MSLVTTVLSATGKLRLDDLSSYVSKLKNRVEEIKADVQDSLKVHYEVFSPHFSISSDLNDKLCTAQNEVEDIIKKMEHEIKPEIQIAVSDFQDLSDQLRDANIIADIVNNLVKIHEYLEACDNAQTQKNYLLSAQSLQKVQHLITQTINYEKSLKIVQILKVELTVRREKLAYDLKEILDQSVIWAFEEEITKITILPDLDMLTGLIRALYLMNNLKVFVEKFGRNLMSHMLKPVMNTITEVKIVDNSALIISIKSNDHPLPVEVFCNVNITFQFLCNTIFDIPLLKENENGQFEETMMKILGRIIAEEFCQCLIQDCLEVALPSHTKDLEDYSKVIQMTTDLQQMLIDVGFLCKDLSSTLEYVQNIDVLFANKMCQGFLVRARNVLKKELHNIVTIVPEAETMELAGELDKTITSQIDETVVLPQQGLNDTSFKFQKCQVSIFTKEIIELLHEVMQEAIKSNFVCATKLFYTARNICELYCDVVPIYHKDRISSIPQLTAIHHNNCMYLAHNLLTIGHYYRNRLPACLSKCTITFIDLVSQLRNLAKLSFLEQMKEQRQQLLNYLQDNNVFQNLCSDENLLPKAEKAVRQCLCQLQFLYRAWNEVLPYSVYCRTIGTLLNTCLEEIILRIISLEDITVPCASKLVSIFNLIISQVPELFKTTDNEKEERPINYYVKRWDKFQKLQWILEASMREIVGLWADGKGVLAAEFAADEVKQLIRALFQNTDRRAAALAKIR